MALSKNELKEAFREVISSEFEDVPKEESGIHYNFSERFLNKMEKLIHSQKKIYWNFVNAGYKRVAIFCVVLLLFVCSVCEPFIKIPRSIKQEYVKSEVQTQKGDYIITECEIKDLPEGYILTNKTVNKNSVVLQYENNLGDVIELMQRPMGESDRNYPSSNIETIIVNGVDIVVYSEEHTNIAVWNVGRIVFELKCPDNISRETMKQMIISIE